MEPAQDPVHHFDGGEFRVVVAYWGFFEVRRAAAVDSWGALRCAPCVRTRHGWGAPKSGGDRMVVRACATAVSCGIQGADGSGGRPGSLPRLRALAGIPPQVRGLGILRRLRGSGRVNSPGRGVHIDTALMRRAPVLRKNMRRALPVSRALAPAGGGSGSVGGGRGAYPGRSNRRSMRRCRHGFRGRYGVTARRAPDSPRSAPGPRGWHPGPRDRRRSPMRRLRSPGPGPEAQGQCPRGPASGVRGCDTRAPVSRQRP